MGSTDLPTTRHSRLAGLYLPVLAAREWLRKTLKRAAHRHPGVVNALKALDDRMALTYLSLMVPKARTLPVDASLPFGVNAIGYMSGEFSLAESARAMVTAVQAAEIPCVVNSIRNDLRFQRAQAALAVREDNPYRVNLVHFNPQESSIVFAHKGWDYFKGRYNIGVWYWELPTFPRLWLSDFDLYHEIWVTSAFCEEAIKAVSPVPVTRVVHPIIIDDARIVRDRAPFGLPDDRFIFFYAFDFISRAERKNPLAIVQAFRRAFTDEPGALLVLKCVNAHLFPDEMRRLAVAAEGLNVRFMDRLLTRAEMISLMASVDSYVSLHRAEGLGLGMAESMYLGKPVIATGYSGNLDFMTPDNSFLVEYRLVDADPAYGYFAKGSQWAEADVAHAAECMRIVYTDRARAAAIGARGAADIRSRMTPHVCGAQIKARLSEVPGLRG